VLEDESDPDEKNEDVDRALKDICPAAAERHQAHGEDDCKENGVPRREAENHLMMREDPEDENGRDRQRNSRKG